MSATAASRYRLWLGLALALTAFKLWLTRGQGVFAIGSAGHDDRLFLELAQHLIRGEWLGPYHELTLAKGPFYSLFIAAAFSIGVPLFLAQHLFYAAACGLFVRALRPALTQPVARFALYALLLWNPMTYDAASMGRVLRQHVYGPLALMIFAGLIALYLRRSEPARRQYLWAILLGFAGAAFYLTREEVVWLLPSVVLLAGAGVHGAWQISREVGRRTLVQLGLGLLVAALPITLVSTLNQRNYGWFGTCEFRSTEFADAYGAMLRVRIGPELPYVPVTREAREAMSKVSPAFAEVQRQFDAGVASGWAGASESLTHLPPEQGQIAGGWLVWALREATAKAGHYGSAGEAMKFYGQMAREINQACDDGRLAAGPWRSGFMPPWHDYQSGPFLHAAVDFADFLVSFSRFSARPPFSTGSQEELQLFRDLTRERLSPPAGELDRVGAARYVLNLKKVEILQNTGKALRPVLLWLFLLAQTLVIFRAGWLVWHRQWTFPLTVAVAAWGACVASLLIHAIIEVTSYPVLTVSSFAPLYPLVIVFIGMAFWDALAAWSARKTARPPNPANGAEAEYPPGPSAAPRGLQQALPWLAGLAAFAPFLIWHREFSQLFWFGDDFLLVDQIAQMGIRDWTMQVFSENFVPVFKLLWGGSVLVFDGSYAALLWLLWLTHALNTILFGRWLQRAGFPWLAVLVAPLVFALTPINLETLGWSVQWSAVLATSFMLMALSWLEQHRAEARLFSARLHVPLFFLAAASACSFSRGVLTGAVLALGLLLPALLAQRWREAVRQLPGAILVLIPALLVTGVIMHSSSGNHQQMAGHWPAAIEFGATYFLLNPGHLLLGDTSLHPLVMLLLALTKLGLVGLALYVSRGRVRHLLLLLLAYDLGNAALIGVGRYHTGFLAAMSSRYQYSSLLATLPFLALLLDHALTWLPLPTWRTRIAIAGTALVVALVLWGWPAALADFTGWRGTEVRQLISAPATSDPAVRVPALEFMHIERAKALQRAFNLH